MHPLERRRKAAGLTQAELGEKIGVAASTIYKWETGDMQPSPSQYPKLAEALGITPMEATLLIAPESQPGESTSSAA